MGTNRKKQAKMAHGKTAPGHGGKDDSFKAVQVTWVHKVCHRVESLITARTRCGERVSGWGFHDPALITCEGCLDVHAA